MSNLKDIPEEYFYQFQRVSNSRLSPTAISTGFIPLLICSGLIGTLPLAITLSENADAVHAFWYWLSIFSYGFFGVQLIATIVFLNVRIALRYQKLQVLLLCIFATKFPLDFYQLLFLSMESLDASRIFFIAGFLFLLVGIALPIYTTRIVIGRVKQGTFREKGEYLRWNIRWDRLIVQCAAIYIVLTIVGVLNTGEVVSSIKMVFYLFVLLFIQSGFALNLIPELYLLTYCKFRFPSFHVAFDYHVSGKDKIRRGKRTSRTHNAVRGQTEPSLSFWFSRPMLAIKSRAGWDTDVQAPIWALPLVWGQFSALVFIVLLYIIGMKESLETLVRLSIGLAILSIAIAFVVIAIVRLVTGLLRRYLDPK